MERLLRRSVLGRSQHTKVCPIPRRFHKSIGYGPPLHFASSFSSQSNFTSTSGSSGELPSEARVVIIGGGIIGTSIAYHLSKHDGWGKGVVLLEQNKITSGTTWHAAGLVETFGSLSETSTSFRKYTRDLYATLENETGVSTGWFNCGFIELASSRDYLEQYRRVAAFNRRHGVEVHEIGPKDVLDLFPLARVDDVLAGFYVPGDGRANPVDVTMSLQRGAKNGGARFFEGVHVQDVVTKHGTATGVRLQDGRVIQADFVVNAAGMWARQLGEKNGVTIANQAAEHYYLVTEPMKGVEPHWPVIEDPGLYTYIRPEGAGLLVGLFEPEAAAWAVHNVPADDSFLSLPPDWERLGPVLEKALSRVPASTQVGIKTFFCGPESFTPDQFPIIGESPEIRKYFVAAGMNSLGILSGGGVGRLVAHWITQGRPDMDVTAISPARFHPAQATPDYRSHRVVESLGMTYKCHYPSHNLRTARNVKLSPLHDRLKSERAHFRDVSGWESPGWYAPEGKEPVVDEENRTGWWNRENWFPYWAAEHQACREKVALIDMSFMAKFLVQGRDAGKVLNRLSTANVDGPSEMVTYTQFLNQDGRVEADLTVNKLFDDRFVVVATDTAHRHLLTLIKRGIEDLNAHAFVTDVTGSIAQINIQGPNARKLMELVTNADMSDAAFPFRGSKHIPIGYAIVNCVRLTYVGELGYELYIPCEQAIHVYDRIVEANKKSELGLTHVGLRALGSLRMEKAYKDYGHDVDNTDSVLEASLGFTCDFKKDGGFIGKEAVLAEKKGPEPMRRRLLQVLVKDPVPLLYHGEPIFRDGKVCGVIRSSSYGHTLGGSVGLSMIDSEEAGWIGKGGVNKEFIETGNWEIEIGHKRYPCVVSQRPLYDPQNAKIKL
eukprot:TRINITY_DN10063_c0_g1_i1.p1 TRINITY_DN10063_c0_g1~~TRINITY_DN10063_c0_g1_i1.p1  ORF type:complete len:899 (-),score=149.22 TRINITY_DN10063_c0_g1_i1:49-2715(-)